MVFAGVSEPREAMAGGGSTFSHATAGNYVVGMLAATLDDHRLSIRDTLRSAGIAGARFTFPYTSMATEPIKMPSGLWLSDVREPMESGNRPP